MKCSTCKWMAMAFAILAMEMSSLTRAQELESRTGGTFDASTVSRSAPLFLGSESLGTANHNGSGNLDLASGLNSTTPYSELIVFGGNFEDSGNVAILSPPIFAFSAPPSPPYFEGRFSNGPTWVDTLADHFGMKRPIPSVEGGTNYAYGGAATGSWPNDLERFGVLNVDDQVSEYLQSNAPQGTELFFVPGWTAGVDFSDGQTDVAESATFVGQAISDLAAAGATEIIVMNDPPGSRLRNADAFRKPFNKQLAEELDAQRLAYPRLKIHEFDAAQVLSSVLDNPAAFGISFLEGNACNDCGVGLTPNPTQIAENPNEFLYWDDVDFSAPIHKLLGDEAYKLFAPAVAGDFNENGNLEPSDLDILAAAIQSSRFETKFDIDGDGDVSSRDHAAFITELAGTTVGDTNLDGSTDFTDFLALSKNFGTDGGWGEGNFGLDTQVGFDDFLALSANFGTTGRSIGQSVPEPHCVLSWAVLGWLAMHRLRGPLR